MSDILVLEVVIYFTIFLQVMGLAFAVFIDPYISKRHSTVILINTALTTLLIIQNYWDTMFALDPDKVKERLITAIIGYCLRPVIIVMWLYLIKKKQKLIISWVLVGINTLIHLSALFTDVCFTITKENIFQRGPLGYSCHIISGILLIFLLWLSADSFIELTGRNDRYDYMPDIEKDWKFEVARYRYGLEGLIPVWCVIVILGAVLMDSKIYSPYLPITFLTMSIVSCNLFYYVWIHLNFVREHEGDIMEQQRIQIMVSQIQPHFLYNTLSTIQALCHSDPERAADTVEKFGTYLRQNIDSLNETDLIPFDKELEHTKVYVDIEQIRFPFIRVVYDIDEVKDTDFELPALTIQPMVENAIRHGVRSKRDGRIVIGAHKEEGFFKITVQDNGIGFDINEHSGQSGSHIGILNVKRRIEDQCKGTFAIESTPGEGTLVTMRIPETDKDKE